MLAIILAQAADALTFICAASVLPISGELNPVARSAFAFAGIAGVVGMKVVGTAGVMVFVVRTPHVRFRRVLLVAVTVVAMAGALGNTLSVWLAMR